MRKNSIAPYSPSWILPGHIPAWERNARRLVGTLSDSAQRAIRTREAQRRFDAPDYQAALATTLAELGKVEEAERLALDARAHAVPEDTSCQIFATTALAAVRAAQGRDDEAQELFLSAIGDAKESNYRVYELHPLEHLTAFLHARGRGDEAARYEARIVELSPATDMSTERIA